MTDNIKAIDFMYYVATSEFMEKWDRAKEGELVCCMEKAIGGLPRFGAPGTAAALGLGNGAVFKLVPQYFPRETGTVTGLVGAAGGLGGFFPPLLLGVIRSQTGTYTLGFVFLSAFALLCLAVNYFVFVRRSEMRTAAVPS
jgi:nitrate/nitrite transporter NarK